MQTFWELAFGVLVFVCVFVVLLLSLREAKVKLARMRAMAEAQRSLVEEKRDNNSDDKVA